MVDDLDQGNHIFNYPISHWYGYIVGVIVGLLSIGGMVYQLQTYVARYGSTTIWILVGVAFAIVGFFGFQQVRRLTEPKSVAVTREGLQVVYLWKDSHLIRWTEIADVAEDFSPFSQGSFKSMRIKTKDGASFLFGAHLRGYDQFEKEVRKSVIVSTNSGLY